MGNSPINQETIRVRGDGGKARGEPGEPRPPSRALKTDKIPSGKQT